MWKTVEKYNVEITCRAKRKQVETKGKITKQYFNFYFLMLFYCFVD